MILCVTLVDQEDVFEDDEVVLLPEMASVLPFFFPNGRRLLVLWFWVWTFAAVL